MIDALPPHRAALARETLAWGDRFWDDARALIQAPPGANAGDAHLVPQSAWYAYGLLLRNEGADRRRALGCLEALLDLQYDEPGTPWHGTFARFAAILMADMGSEETAVATTVSMPSRLILARTWMSLPRLAAPFKSLTETSTPDIRCSKRFSARVKRRAR